MTWKFKYRKQAFVFLKENELLEKVRNRIVDFIRGEIKGRVERFS